MLFGMHIVKCQGSILFSQKGKLVIHDPIREDATKCTVGLENGQYSDD